MHHHSFGPGVALPSFEYIYNFPESLKRTWECRELKRTEQEARMSWEGPRNVYKVFVTAYLRNASSTAFLNVAINAVNCNFSDPPVERRCLCCLATANMPAVNRLTRSLQVGQAGTPEIAAEVQVPECDRMPRRSDPVGPDLVRFSAS
jgi:hypothetical protein